MLQVGEPLLDVARARVLSFLRAHGEPHIALAMHAAVPLGLTPELLHLLRVNFLRRVPWVAEADLLLSSLCQEAGGGYYYLERDVREYLLEELRHDPEYGMLRLRRVADFLLAYAGRGLRSARSPEARAFLMAQEWTGLAYLRPAEAAAAMAEALSKGLATDHRQDQLRVTGLVQALAAPLVGEDTLLVYAAGVERLATGQTALALRFFRTLGSLDQAPTVAGIRLPAPRQFPLIAEAAEELPRHFTNPLGMQFVLVPKGTFWMSKDDKNAQRQVEIAHNFYLGAYQVTQGQWQAVMGNNPSYFSRTGDGKDRVQDIDDKELQQFPVECVSWKDAQKFLQKISAKYATPGWTYRLPTEAEWEYACRGGAVSKEDCSYDFYLDQPTNDLDVTHANFNGKYPAGKAPEGQDLNRTCKVGSCPPNRLGIYDMHGNVWEWCHDVYIIESGSLRVIRGGSWNFSADYARAACRGRHAPTSTYSNLGLRLARVPVREPSKASK